MQSADDLNEWALSRADSLIHRTLVDDAVASSTRAVDPFQSCKGTHIVMRKSVKTTAEADVGLVNSPETTIGTTWLLRNCSNSSDFPSRKSLFFGLATPVNFVNMPLTCCPLLPSPHPGTLIDYQNEEMCSVLRWEEDVQNGRFH